jgi:uncharacterized membrane protein YfcA
MDPGIIIALAIASFLAAFIDSIAGGGGLILLPSLLVAGIPPQLALGTNKFAAMFGTGTALSNFIRNKKVIWKIAFIGIAFSLVGSALGAKAILLFNQETIAKIIMALLPITAIVTFIPKKQLKTKETSFSKANLFFHVPFICLTIGFYDGFFGPGTGSFLIFFFYVFLGLHLVNSSAVSKVFNFSSNIGAFIAFAVAGKVLYTVGIPIAVANIAGGFLGSHLAIRKGQKLVKFFLIMAFIILFITLAVKYLNFGKLL